MSVISKANNSRFVHFKNAFLLAVALLLINHIIPAEQWQQLLLGLHKLPMFIALPVVASVFFTYAVATTLDYIQWRKTRLTKNESHGSLWPQIMEANLRQGFNLSHSVELPKLVQGVRADIVIYGGALLFLLTGTFLLAPNIFRVNLAPSLFLGGACLFFAFIFFVVRAVVLSRFMAQAGVPALVVKQIAGSYPHALVKQFLFFIPAALALYLPLIHFTGMHWHDFIAIYLAAHIAGVASRVPGGAGIFESVFLFLSAHFYPPAQIFVALVAYRVFYYGFPLGSSLIALVIFRWRRSKAASQTVGFDIYQLPGRLFQPAISCGLLVLSAALMGFLPGAVDAEKVIHVPPYLLSLAGIGVLFCWRCHWQKIDLAYYCVLLIGLVFFLTKILIGNYFSAGVTLLIFWLFSGTKTEFYRQNAALQGLLSRQVLSWYLLGIFLLFGPIIFLTQTNNLEYLTLDQWLFSKDLCWWEQILFVVGITTGLTTLYLFLMRCDIAVALPDKDEIQAAKTLALKAGHTQAQLVLCGDKTIFWSDTGKTFLMFGKTQRFWIVMGDPVGDIAEFKPLLRKLACLADQAKAQLALYKVDAEHIGLYADLGMGIHKLGEEARISLPEFSLAGTKRLSLRNSFNRHCKDGLEFEVIKSTNVAPLLPQLEKISNAWLDQKNTQEKQFSLGKFDADYLQAGDLAIVHKQGEIFAFANLWQLENKEEISLDLMRYAPEGPKRVMEFLTISLILWGQQQGYQRFNLGMAPLSGLEPGQLAPWSHKLGHYLFAKGNRFYNFSGVYTYKEKYTPHWHSRYLVGPKGIHLLWALLAVAKLVAGSTKGMMLK